MATPPADLAAFVAQVRAKCGFTDPVEVGMLPNAAHLASGGYHCGVTDIRSIGRYDSDYSTRQGRDRRPADSNACAVDIGDNWPRGGRAAWLRFNNLLVAELKAGSSTMPALRATNFSPDGTAKRRFDTNNRAQGVIASTDTVDIHTHLEFWRDTVGNRQATLNRILQLIDAAITGGTPTPEGDDPFMSGNFVGTESAAEYFTRIERALWAPAAAQATAAAADAKAARLAIEALSAALNNAGGSVDSAAIIAHMDQLAAAELARDNAELLELRAAKAAAEANLSDAEKAALPTS